jgi:hypothetical protein
MTVLAPPAEICIYSDEYRPGILQFLNFIETMGVKHGRKLEIDLSKVRFASAAASLLFLR